MLVTSPSDSQILSPQLPSPHPWVHLRAVRRSQLRLNWFNPIHSGGAQPGPKGLVALQLQATQWPRLYLDECVFLCLEKLVVLGPMDSVVLKDFKVTALAPVKKRAPVEVLCAV